MTRANRCLMHLSLRLLLAAFFIHSLAQLYPMIQYGSMAALIQRENPPRAVAPLPAELRAEIESLMAEHPDIAHELPKVKMYGNKAGLEDSIPALVKLLTQPIDTGDPRQDMRLAMIRSLTRPADCQFFVSEGMDFGVTFLIPAMESVPNSLDEVHVAYVCAVKDGILRRYDLSLYKLRAEEEAASTEGTAALPEDTSTPTDSAATPTEGAE